MNKPVITEAIITDNQKLTDEIFELKVVPEVEFPTPEPFQFATLHIPGFELRRPFSIAGFEKEKNELRFVIKNAGRMTRELSGKASGERISILGPLGTCFDYSKYERILCVAGGVGIAPFLYLFQMKATEMNFSLIYGVKTVDSAWYEEIYTDLKGFLLVTEDGSSGYEGYPVDYIFSVTSYFKPDCIIAVGPEGMLKSLKTVSLQLELDVFVSLENYLGCALGACGSCLVKTVTGDYVKVCEEGPVFNIESLEIGE